MSKFTIIEQITFGFGLTLILMMILTAVFYSNLLRITHKTKNAIYKNELTSTLAQKEIAV